uniref:Conserved secreted protein n=1 Tax=Globodera pallida TaxID=36090 RepID=A0A183C6L7_GLOPA
MFCKISLAACIHFGVLSVVTGLKCQQEFALFEPESKFKNNTLEVECAIQSHRCIYVKCTASSTGKTIPFTEHVGCEDPKRVNCKKLGDECATKNGKICCQTCDTDLCNVDKICPGNVTVTFKGGSTITAGGVAVVRARVGVVVLLPVLSLLLNFFAICFTKCI